MTKMKSSADLNIMLSRGNQHPNTAGIFQPVPAFIIKGDIHFTRTPDQLTRPSNGDGMYRCFGLGVQGGAAGLAIKLEILTLGPTILAHFHRYLSSMGSLSILIRLISAAIAVYHFDRGSQIGNCRCNCRGAN